MLVFVGLLFLIGCTEGHAGLADLTLLTEAAQSGAVCLDGTPGAYYFRQGWGDGANKWFIFHEAGAWCFSLEHCYARSLTDSGSSKNYPPSIDLSGAYFDPDPLINPQMYNWNIVFLRYCDGGSFSGNNATATYFNNTFLYFRGFSLLQAMHQDLFNNRGLQFATDAVISGCSAGGLATFLHLDWWKMNLAHHTHVVGFIDSGFFLDYESSTQQFHSNMLWTFEWMAAKDGVNQACITAHSKSPWMCFFAQYAAHFIQTPIFALQPLYDWYQIDYILGTNETAAVNQYGKTLYTHFYDSLLRWTVRTVRNGAFVDSCNHHCGAWGDIHIQGKNQALAFMGWYAQSKEIYFQEEDQSLAFMTWSAQSTDRIFFQYKAYPCESCCETALD